VPGGPHGLQNRCRLVNRAEECSIRSLSAHLAAEVSGGRLDRLWGRLKTVDEPADVKAGHLKASQCQPREEDGQAGELDCFPVGSFVCHSAAGKAQSLTSASAAAPVIPIAPGYR
jgi:hypothetical protein